MIFRRFIVYMLFFFLSVSPLTSWSQNEKYRLFLTLGISATSYKGDLSDRYQSWSGGFDASLLFNKKHRMNGCFHLNIGSVQGENNNYSVTDNPSATPNTFFTTNYFSLGYELRINILKNERWLIFVSPGIQALRFNPRDQFKESLTNQFSTRAKNETFNPLTISLPLKLGGAYFTKHGFGLGCEIGFLHPSSDYIDNISEWGNRSKKDNLLQSVFKIYIPIKQFHREAAGG
ncbi:MAG: outer membrane beta-barrel protein [Cytophagaceae bacterium]|nr:outer membrane beta-barrel protein [Cytophagaceae bacterium]